VFTLLTDILIDIALTEHVPKIASLAKKTSNIRFLNSRGNWLHLLLIHDITLFLRTYYLLIRILAIFLTWTQKNVVGHCMGPTKAHLCVIPRVVSHWASKIYHGSLQ